MVASDYKRGIQNMRLLYTILAIFWTSLAIKTPVAQALEIKGIGATFPSPLYAKWAEAYKAETGQTLSYDAIGSGGGIKHIKAGGVTFGASDMPLPHDELEKSGLIQFPTVIGGLVPIINIPGVKSGELVFDGPTLAKIFLGEIKAWDDPAIKKLNAHIKLPSLPIVVVHRSDGSGTSFIWTDYLSKVSEDWKKKVGASTHVQWPEGIGGQGNDGVAKNVIDLQGAVGYVEAAFAKRKHIPVTKLINKTGQIVFPNMKSFEAAATNADWLNADHFNVSLTNQPGAETWPVAGATFILMQKKPIDVSQSKAALQFFSWAYENGDKLAEELEYVPFPDFVVKHIKKSWATEFIWPDGKSLNLM